jgi:hypothetical protein
VDVPSWTASFGKSVQVSLDDPSFASAVNANVASSGTSWTTAFTTPAVGKHTIYARSTQGFDTSATVTRSISVTR